MDFTEFKRRLGAEPRSQDAELLRARDQGPEFAAEAEQAEAFERGLERALEVPVPDTLVDELKNLPRAATPRAARSWWPAALAAGLLLALGGTALYRQINPHWESVEAYVIDHYQHDGFDLLALVSEGVEPADAEAVQAMFERFDLEATPALSDVVGVIKVCVTPDGKGIHMVLNTAEGLATVIYMPGTTVLDRSRFDFNGQHAVLVRMDHGSAAIIGSEPQDPARLYAFVQGSIRPRTQSG